MRPVSISRFERLYLASQGLSILAIMSHYSFLRNQAIMNGRSPASPFLGVILILLIAAPIWYFIARRASGAAKWINVALFAIALFGAPTALQKSMAIGPAYLALSLLSFALLVGLIVMLFKADATRWLRAEGRPDNADPDVFS